MATQSMTGFCSVEGRIQGRAYRLEIKTLNHRFLDLKLRLPRELSMHEMALRTLLPTLFARGSLELKLERQASTEGGEAVSAPAVNFAVAAHYYESLLTLQKTLGLNDPIRTIDLVGMPDVLARATEPERGAESEWPELESLVRQGCEKLKEMRLREGSALVTVLNDALKELESAGRAIRARRADWETLQKQKLSARIASIFESYPLSSSSTQAVLETRVSQELAILLDRSDIEEELARLEGHVKHFRETLASGGPIGRKLDFLAQEMGREVNTLGNKAQDLAMSEIAVPMKVKLEQIREQVMNLE